MNDKMTVVNEVKKIFDKLLTIKGIENVQLHTNVIDRSNRFDLMIIIEMDKAVLETYDKSEPHHEWKEKYGKFVENKAIFDYED